MTFFDFIGLLRKWNAIMFMSFILIRSEKTKIFMFLLFLYF